MSDNMTTIPSLMDQVKLFKNNPVGIRRVVLNQLRLITEGKINVVDPTTPFSHLLSSTCVLTSAFMVEHEAGLRRQYPSLSQTEEELYLHMSDKDYIDRFASPSMTRFHLLIDLEELKSKMVLNPSTGVRKVVIPANSEFVISDTVFSLQYPIEIKQLTHGGLQVIYDTTNKSPLQSLTTNIVDWSIQQVSVTKQELLHLEFDVYQFKIASYKGDLISTTGYRKKHAFGDQYYHSRVYFKNNATNNLWEEIYTTHTDQVYDPLKPTAVLTVYDGELEVMIPQIYFTTNQISGSLRVDIYQTKGPVNMILENYKPTEFSANFILIDKNALTPEMAAFQSIDSVFPYANTIVSGGKDAIGFSQLRQRVIMNTTGQRHLPVTNVQIETALENSGFDIVKNVDVITNRQFLATKLLPAPFDEKLITAASASIETLIASMDQLRSHPKVRDNGDRITLIPEMLYVNNNSIISVVSPSEEADIASLEPEALVDRVNNNKYLYTPFHYVLDGTSDSFETRPYYLNNPEAITCQFVSQNDTVDLQVNTGGYKLVKTADGFKLYIEVISNKAYKALDDSLVHVQLSYQPTSETSRAYLNGRLIGLTDDDERLFEFDIGSNFDIDKEDRIWLDSFSLFTSITQLTPSQLTNTFQLYYSTSALMPGTWISRTEDNELGKSILPTRIAFLTKENIDLKFGSSLSNLWSSSRSIAAASEYQKYSSDLIATYPEDIYEIDPATGAAFKVDATGTLTYNVIHKKGDVIKDAAGLPTYIHRAGDIILDDNGVPVPVSQNTVVRQLDIMFIEGCYFFATDVASVTYRETIVRTIVDWITIDLFTLSKQLIEQTKLFYYPKMTMGTIRIMNDAGVVTAVEANQDFLIRLYVPELTYDNDDLRTELKSATIRTIDAHLKNSTISVSTLTSMLRDIYKGDVYAFDVSGFGKNKDIQMLTILKDGENFAIKKKLVVQSDGKLIITEAVSVDFVKHKVQ